MWLRSDIASSRSTHLSSSYSISVLLIEMSQALAIPGTIAPVAPAATGAAALDPRFLAMLQEAKVPDSCITDLGDKEIENAALFGSVATEETLFYQFLKQVLNIDPTVRPGDFLITAKLRMVGDLQSTPGSRD